MKRQLAAIAKQLSEADIHEILRIKKSEDERAGELLNQRAKLIAELGKIDKELAAHGVDAAAAEATEAAPRRRGRPGKAAKTAQNAAKKKPGRKPAVAKAVAVAKPGRKAGKRRGLARGEFTSAVREVFSRAGGPLKARQVVEGLPEVGMPVSDPAEMRKRISVVLSQNKNHFEQIDRGLYRLKD